MSVKNSTFLDLKNLTFALIGREYLSATAQFARLVALWNQGAKKAYRASNYWDRHLVVGEPRTVFQGHVASSEDGFYISDAGETKVNGLYTYGPEYDGHNSYILNGNSITFDVTEYATIPDYVGTYKLDATYDSLSNHYNRGVWVNQTNSNKVIAYNHHQNRWELVDLVIGSQITGSTSLEPFPWMNSNGITGMVFGNAPEEVYQIDRNIVNNHWELQKFQSNGEETVLYKDGNGNIPSETAWEIVNGVNPTLMSMTWTILTHSSEFTNSSHLRVLLFRSATSMFAMVEHTFRERLRIKIQCMLPTRMNTRQHTPLGQGMGMKFLTNT